MPPITRTRVHLTGLIAAIVVLAACSGGSSSQSTNTASPFSSTYLKVSLSTGIYTAIAAAEAPAADTVIFKRLNNGNYLSITEVTRAQWTLLMSSSPWTSVPSAFQGTSSDTSLPANNLSRDDATAFAATAAARSSLAISVPGYGDYTDAFGGSGHEYPWSSGADTGALANTREAGFGVPVPVRSLQASNGFYGLVGNVREWTSAGQLIGGGWLDNLSVSNISKALSTVDPEIRHPQCGCRLVIRN